MIREKDINKKYKARTTEALTYQVENYRRKVELLEMIEERWEENDYRTVI